MGKNEKGQIITVLKPAEMAERMKKIMGNINTIATTRSTKTPQGNDITEKAKDRINAKMKEIGQAGIKRTAHQKIHQKHEKQKNKPQDNKTPVYQTNMATNATTISKRTYKEKKENYGQ